MERRKREGQRVLVKSGIRQRTLRFREGKRMGAGRGRRWGWPGGDTVNRWAVTFVTKPPVCYLERAGPAEGVT